MGMFSVPPGTEMFQFPGCPRSDLWIQSAVTRVGLVSWLFAACRVLLRSLAPRHPPCALCSFRVLSHGDSLSHRLQLVRFGASAPRAVSCRLQPLTHKPLT